ncbi:MAG: dienelactone hydrolase family protein [Thermoprotei archaeon]
MGSEDNYSFRPTTYYEHLYSTIKRSLEFNCEDVECWKKWRDLLKNKLTQLLGGLDYSSVPLSPVYASSEDLGDVIRHKVYYWSDSFSKIPAFLLEPKQKNGSAVLALHGHGYGKNDICGLDENGNPKSDPYSGYQKSFALALAKRGFTVLAPDQAGFGERREEQDSKKGPSQDSCWALSTFALLYGQTTIGRRVWDAMRSLDFLSSLPWVTKSLGVMGISGGGMISLYVAALDERVKAAAISGFINTYYDSIIRVCRKHCIDNYVPGILAYAEMYDVASLIPPRALYAENGTKDPIFPVEGFRKAVPRIRHAYDLLGASGNFEAVEFEGEHEISGPSPYDFLERLLLNP